ncbi:hypothetical protein AYO47_09710 [Planctomyces sp. SCGC AG-212-M04]|nr:hypothetical protein AYO47_09710 [Planctomyces sp. SCGC AG-212-M04]
MRKVSRHNLIPEGSTYRSDTSDFLVSDNRDFHPTDVVEDADGSILVVDTGGWYKLCCPTSQLPKPDVLGAIYRLRRKDAPRVDDPRGLSIAWNKQTADSLCELLADPRPAVRRRAQRQLVHTGSAAVDALRRSVASIESRSHGPEVVWTLAQIDSEPARRAIRDAHFWSDPKTQRCAAWVMGNLRDTKSAALLIRMLGAPSGTDARIAAMALGRIGSTTAIPLLMSRLAGETDRGLEHALIYAAIETNDTASLRPYLADPRLPVRRAAMIAIDQIDAKSLRPEDIVAALGSSDPALTSAAWWVSEQHLPWAESLAPQFQRLSQANDSKALLAHLPAFAAEPATQRLMAELLLDGNAHRDTRLAVLRSMSVKRPKPLPPVWREPLARALQSSDEDSINAALDVIRPEGRNNVPRDFEPALNALAGNEKLSPRLRLMAQSFLPPQRRRPVGRGHQSRCVPPRP